MPTRAGCVHWPRRRSSLLDHLRGSVVSVGADSAVIAIGGVGLRVQMPSGDLGSLQGEVLVHTILQVRDDDLHLYGFATERGREMFRALTSVNGVGPKLALAVLSFYAPDALERAIVAGDADAIVLVPGVGKKIGQRIVLELRDKLGLAEPASATGALADVRDALKELGFSPGEIQGVLSELPADGDAPTLLRLALRMLGAGEHAGVGR